ncbi:hypothetical protein cyc_06944 [Cyclospora cayetanensis]|uniref:Transmembrane protein n=1 Tax=Cyclospora cayetanensis TaxID=88456 RepID=A0A1D3D079_9EIME|nr:hypothetical protein cyc_06944 [Cyclospora cayetanensis]
MQYLQLDSVLQLSLMASSTVYFFYLWGSTGVHPFRMALHPQKYLIKEKEEEDTLERRLRRELGETT